MDTFKLVRLLGMTTAIAAAPALMAVMAHAQATAPAPSTAPGQVKPVPPPSDLDADMPKGGAGASPSGSSDTKVSPPTAPLPGKSAGAGSTGAGSTGAATIKDVTVGTAVFGSDGQKIGEVKGVKSEPGGIIEEIHVKTGGLLGFGGKVVVIPGAKISKGGQAIQIAMTADEVGKLPAMPEHKS